jgi:hypothetical protein
MNKRLSLKLILIAFILMQLIMVSNDASAKELSEMHSGITKLLNGIWGSSGNVFAVGSDSTILYYDGNTWSNMNSGIPYVVLRDVWGSSGSDVFAVSLRGSFLLHYDGNSWTNMNIDSSLPGDSSLYGIWGSSGSDVFAVGGRQSTDSAGIILHYNGSTWSSMNTGTKKYLLILTDVWGSSGTDVFAVGSSGTILHYDGNSWSEMESTVTNNLWGVWGSSGSNVFAVGEGGIIINYDGSNWSEIESGTSKWLNGIWGSSGTNVFAVGYSGTILHYDGSTWSAVSSGTTEDLYDVWGSSGSDVFAVGETILHYDGNTWSEMSIEGSGCIVTYLLEDKPPQLNALRYLRDNVLNKTPAGQEIVRLYYEWSPVIVKAMQEDEDFKEQMKEMIDGVLGLIVGER